MELVQYSKDVDVEEDKDDFEDNLPKQAEPSKNCSDWKAGGCGICKFPRTPHQRFAIKHRLCTSGFLRMLIRPI